MPAAPQDRPGIDPAPPDAGDPGACAPSVAGTAATAAGGELAWDLFRTQGEAQAAMLADIRAAQRTIDLEQYIFEGDETGGRFAAALAERAAAGVAVRVLVDAVGSKSFLFGDGPERLRAAGVALRVFHPPHRIVRVPLRRLSRRTHRKILVVDANVAHIGGTGISDEMAGWRDANLRLTGAVVGEIGEAFGHLWRRERPPVAPVRPPVADGTARFVTTATARHRSPIYDHVLDALEAARDTVVLTTPYFVPDGRLRRALARACARGVTVRLLIPARSDKAPVDALSWWSAKRVMRAGVDVRTWPDMLHGKVQVVDDRWVSVGSSNLDRLSFFGNEEGNLIAAVPALAAALRAAVDADLARAEPLTEARWRDRPAMLRVLGWLLRPVKPFL